MAHTFEELVEMQRAADQARNRVIELRDTYGPPTTAPWTAQQTSTYETAWRAWRDLARDVQAAVTAYATDKGAARNEVEEQVKKTVRHPDTEGDGA
ncbi:hypothetical protein [Streptomyces stelliscabiei]|uniref:hypothetical protein n=1 Tax=Streptomyces stelliscabiei TaxID=146820 RepID=UPI0029B2426F|nr:hypothetical protein [Streptomyces stelliscabiei]MDX2550088.1 hypothetical protein [Streptomyces stelliscabiei]